MQRLRMTITRRFGHPWICSSSSSADHLPPTIEKMSTSAGLLLSRATPLRAAAPGQGARNLFCLRRSFASRRAPTPMLFTAQSPYDSKKATDFLQSLHDLDIDVVQSRHTILGSHSCFNLLLNAPENLSVEDVSSTLQKKFPEMNFIGKSGVSPFLEAGDKTYNVLDVLGMGVERKGVVPALFNLWDHFGIQIRSFDSVTGDDGFRGVRMIQIRATVAIPTEVDVDRVNEALSQFQEDYGLVVTGEDQGGEDGAGEATESEDSDTYPDYSDYSEASEASEDYDERGPFSRRAGPPPGAYIR